MSALRPGPDETLDVLSNSLRILQRRRGHRAGSDDVILAGLALDAAPAAARVLDLGTGKGTVALLLSRCLPRARLVGVEAFAQSHALAVRNARLNGVADRYRPLWGDVRDPDVLEGQAPFDLVCGAPPFMPVGSGVQPRDPQRAAGRFELRGGVEAYAECAARALAPDGRVVLLLDGDRPRLIAAFERAGLALRRLVGVRPRPGAPPTYTVGVGARTAVGPPLEEAWAMRETEGLAWGSTYQALRRRLDLPGA